MTVECLGAIQWDDPGIVGPVLAAIVAGAFAIVTAIIMRRKISADATGSVRTTVRQTIVAPQIDIDTDPSNVVEPTVKVGLPDIAVEREVGTARQRTKKPDRCTRGVNRTWLRHFGVIPWSHPAIVGPVAAAIAGGLYVIVQQGFMPNRTTRISKAVGSPAMQFERKQPVPASGNPLRIEAVEFFNTGVRAFEEGEADFAIARYEAALRKDWKFAKAHNNLGVALTAKGELDAAIQRFNEALGLEPVYAIAHNNLGVALKAKGEPDAAIEHYGAAIRFNPDRAPYHDNLAIALARKKAVPAAVAALATAIEIDERYRAWAKSDKDFDPIRDDPAFRKLVYDE